MRPWWVLALSACGFTADSQQPIDAVAVDARRVDGMIAPDASLIDAPSCPGNYVQRGTSYYRFVSSPTTWTAAEADCENDSSGLTHLAVLGTGELSTVDAISSATRTWVGLTDRVTDGTWLWVTGAAGPPMGTGQSDCGQLDEGNQYGGPQLQRDECTADWSYVCECDLIAANPAAF